MSNSFFQKIGQGPDIVFLHGWMQDRTTWLSVADRLKNEFTCTLVDLPGFGTNTTILEENSPIGYAHWVEKFLEENKLKKVNLVGHSFGGRVSIILASQSKLITKLILEASPFRRQSTPKVKLTSFASQKLGIRNVPVLSKLLRSKDYQTAGNLREVFLKAVNLDLANYLEHIKIPSLVIWGENDQEFPVSEGQALKQKIRNSKLYLMPTVGHLAHQENPTLFAGLIRKFLKENE